MDIQTQMTENAEPFVQATIETFRKMMNIDIHRGALTPRTDLTVLHDISGMIGLTGEAEGAVSLGFTRSMATAVACNFVGDDYVTDPMMADTVGELVNIITGYAGKDMKQRIRISLPTIVMGSGHILTSRRNDLQSVTSFDSPLGAFHLYVYLEEST
jgi:chemotaxis protein CheX